MMRSSILQQLELDYPGRKISFDKKRSLLLMDNYKVSLLIDEDQLDHINVHSKSGKNLYQAVTQLIYNMYALIPAENSYAEKLITFKEDYEKYKIQNLASDFGIGFIEDGEEVIAVKISSDIDKPIMIEEEEKVNWDQISDPDDFFGYLIEVEEDGD